MMKPIIGKAGQRVTIYGKPFTQEKPEGIAILVLFVCKTDDMETWKVQFVNEMEQYTRAIKF